MRVDGPQFLYSKVSSDLGVHVQTFIPERKGRRFRVFVRRYLIHRICKGPVERTGEFWRTRKVGRSGQGSLTRSGRLGRRGDETFTLRVPTRRTPVPKVSIIQIKFSQEETRLPSKTTKSYFQTPGPFS